MNIELIIFISVWIISTEIIFFKFIRKEGEKFIPSKILSIILGGFMAFVLFGIPWRFASGMGTPREAYGNIVYFWYYGVAIVIGIFFLVNYKIHKYLKKKESGAKRRKKR